MMSDNDNCCILARELYFIMQISKYTEKSKMCPIMGEKTNTVKGTSMGIRISNELENLKQTTYLCILILRVKK